MNLQKSQRQCPTNLEFAANVYLPEEKCWFLMYKIYFFSTHTYRKIQFTIMTRIQKRNEKN